MRRSQIDARLADIVEFAGVQRFMDTPLKRYSTGMAVRLGFAVAAHLEPEVLLVDEVLAVGDAEFQRRCIGKIGEVASSGRTVLFVSHNMSVVARLCTRAIWLDSGRLLREGPAREVVEEYLTQGTAGGTRTWDEPLGPDNPFRPQTLAIMQRGVSTDSVDAREPLQIVLEYELDREIPDFLVELTILTVEGIALLTVRDRDDPEIDARFQSRPPGRYRTACTVPGSIFNEGRFIVRLRVFRPRVEHYLLDERAAQFSVYALGGVGSHPDVPARGILRPSFDWDVEHQAR
jgi:lipopolysaccharide transport system ATP-binding protein